MFYQHYQIEKQTGAGTVIIPNVADSRHLIIAVHADANTTATIKFQGSAQEAVPAFGSAASSSNSWAYVAFRNLGTASLVAGATGIVISNTTHHQIYEIEANGLAHLGIELTSVSGDGVSFSVFPRND